MHARELMNVITSTGGYFVQYGICWSATFTQTEQSERPPAEWKEGCHGELMKVSCVPAQHYHSGLVVNTVSNALVMCLLLLEMVSITCSTGCRVQMYMLSCVCGLVSAYFHTTHKYFSSSPPHSSPSSLSLHSSLSTPRLVMVLMIHLLWFKQMLASP